MGAIQSNTRVDESEKETDRQTETAREREKERDVYWKTGSKCDVHTLGNCMESARGGE